MSTSSKPAATKRPKPLSRDELDRVVKAVGITEMELRRIIGQPSLPTAKQIKPADFPLMQARAARMLAVYPEIREKVFDIRTHFPGATITAIRPLPEPAKKAGS